MSTKKPFTMEFPMRCSASLLYEFVATTNGLQEWFAEQVQRKNDTFYFTWEGSTEEALLLESIQDEKVRYQWVDEDDDSYFEFSITTSSITNETILQITDFAADYELKDQQLLWDSQINDLKQRIGS